MSRLVVSTKKYEPFQPLWSSNVIQIKKSLNSTQKLEKSPNIKKKKQTSLSHVCERARFTISETIEEGFRRFRETIKFNIKNITLLIFSNSFNPFVSF